MKNIAYIIAHDGNGEFIQNGILKSIADRTHGANVIALYFIENGVYHLVKGSRRSKEVSIAMQEQHIKVLASKQSIKERRIQNMMIDGVKLASFDSFYNVTQNADHIISV